MRHARWIVAVALTASLGAGVSAVLARGAAVEQEAAVHDRARADDLADRIERMPTASPEDDQRLMVEGYAAFIASMDAFDGPRAIRLARGMHAHAGAVWSAFCLEGALRRAAPADPTEEAAAVAFAEADGALEALLSDPSITGADALAVTQRRAILAAGFAREGTERAALGRALARGGIDGAQISGLAALERGDHATAARLFGSLLDTEHARDVLPWPVRGHGLAALELLRGAGAR